MRHAIDRVRGAEEAAGAQPQPFNRVSAEMLVEPRPPGGADRVAGLQHGFQARAEAAAHQPEMAAMRARHQLEDGARLPVPLDAEHNAFIGPLHGTSPESALPTFLCHPWADAKGRGHSRAGCRRSGRNGRDEDLRSKFSFVTSPTG